MNLEKTNEELQQEAEKYRSEIRNYVLERQQQRKNIINSPESIQQAVDLYTELEQTRQHLKKMETHLMTCKLQYAEDLSYQKEELNREQVKNKELQQSYNRAVQEKTYFMMKIKKSNSKQKDEGLFKKFTVLR